MPGEAGAAARARRAVLEAHAARPAGRHGDRWRPAIAIAAVLALAVLAGGLSSPGQAVGDWIRDVVERAGAEAGPAGGGAAARGRPAARRHAARRRRCRRTAARPTRVGRYREATWSPRRPVRRGHDRRSALLAVTPHGAVRWRVAPPAPPRAPAWSPDGFRIAYLSGPQLRVVVADGTDDRLFRGHVEPVAPAFRPGAGPHRRVGRRRPARPRRRRRPRPARAGARPSRSRGRPRALLVAPTAAASSSPAGAACRVFDLAHRRVRTTRTRAPVVAAAFPPRGGGAPALLERRAGRSAPAAARTAATR